MSRLIDGRIPPFKKCPFWYCCEIRDGNQCSHKGVSHDRDYSCAVARGFDLLEDNNQQVGRVMNGYDVSIGSCIKVFSFYEDFIAIVKEIVDEKTLSCSFIGVESCTVIESYLVLKSNVVIAVSDDFYSKLKRCCEEV